MKLKRIAVVAVLALGASLVLAACGDDDESSTTTATTVEKKEETPPKPEVETIAVRNGAPVGGVAELVFDAGDQVRFRVSSNVADEVHVHGYDVSEEVPAGGSATFSFPADIEGIFEVELHESEEQIAELRIEP